MKKLSSILWGVALIIVGVIFAFNTLEIGPHINVFFDGWWTLFIIVPCLIGIFSSHEKTGNIVGLIIGVILLLCCQGFIDFDILWKLIVPIIIIFIGVKLIVNGVYGNKTAAVMKAHKDNGNVKTTCATFSGQNLIFDNEVFNGAELTAVFGGIKCDISNAYIEKDCVINTTSIFGGIDVIAPDYVNIKVNSNSIFGGVSNKKHTNTKTNTVTVYINSTCLFGGVDIK